LIESLLYLCYLPSCYLKLIVGVLESDELVIPLLQFLFGGFGYIDRVELLLG